MQEWLRQRILQKMAESDGGMAEEYLAARDGKVPVKPPMSPDDEGDGAGYPEEEIDKDEGVGKAEGVEKKSALRYRAVQLIKQALEAPPGAMPPGAGGPPPMPPGAMPPGAGGPPPPMPAPPPMDPQAMLKAKLEEHMQEHAMMEQMGGGQEQPGMGAPPPMPMEQPGMGVPEASQAPEEGIEATAVQILKDMIYEGL